MSDMRKGWPYLPGLALAGVLALVKALVDGRR